MRHDAEAIAREAARASLLILLFLGLGGCSAQVDGQEAGRNAAQDQAPDARAPDIRNVRLDSVEVIRVDLRSPVERPDARGELRTWEQAFMVRLALPAPPAFGPKADIFVGEERISEYGGWEGGVYFWVYDPARLEALRGQPISYQFDRAERQEIGTLEFGDPEEFRRVPESELRGRNP